MRGQVLELLLEFIDLAIKLLGLATEVQALEFVDQRLQAFDLLITRSKLLHHFFERSLLFEHQRTEFGNGIGK